MQNVLAGTDAAHVGVCKVQAIAYSCMPTHFARQILRTSAHCCRDTKVSRAGNPTVSMRECTLLCVNQTAAREQNTV
jgi:hypothetical protein